MPTILGRPTFWPPSVPICSAFNASGLPLRAVIAISISQSVLITPCALTRKQPAALRSRSSSTCPVGDDGDIGITTSQPSKIDFHHIEAALLGVLLILCRRSGTYSANVVMKLA